MKTNIFLILYILVASCVTFADGTGTIGYGSVSEALDSLKNNPEANVSTQGGWTIISVKENGNPVLWSFTPEKHEAHPSAIKRTIVEKDGVIYIKMRALCQAKKPECDKLIEQFKELNEKIKQSMRKGT